jgi:hypothetical protein
VGKVSKALQTLQFVEKDSIQTSVKAKKVSFLLKDHAKLDMDMVVKALKDEGFSKIQVLSQPTS